MVSACVSKDVCESDYVLKAMFILFFSNSFMFTGVRATRTVRAFMCGHMGSHACLQVCVLCERVCVASDFG